MNSTIKPWHAYAISIVVLALLVAAFVVGRISHGSSIAPHAHASDAASGGQAGTGGTTSATLYTCSMHPQVRATNPKDKCPICGMDLIPVPADAEDNDDGDLPRLRLSPRAAALMQVQVHPVERRAIHKPIRLFGRIEKDETRLRTISAWTSGRLDRLHVNFTGDRVREGDPMVDIYSPELIAAQTEFLHAVRTVRDLDESSLKIVQSATRQTIDTSRDRLRLLGLTHEQIEQLIKRDAAADRLVIPSPVSGVVVERLAAQGDYVQTGQPIFRVADLSSLWVQMEAYESDLPWLSLGLKATFTTQAHPGESFEGSVSFIDPVLNDRTRTVRVRVEVPNADGRLKPGMFVRGIIEAIASAQGDAPSGEVPLVVPATAPLITGMRAVVYVQASDADRPTFEPREVVLGVRAGDWQVVRAGLAEGELVVTHGAFKIDSELQIRGRPSMMQPKGGSPATHDHASHGTSASTPPAAPDDQRMEAPEAFRTQFGKLVLANFKLVHALAADDHPAAREAAKSAEAALGQLEPAQLGDDRARRHWADLAGAMRDALAACAGADDLAGQRRHFEPFSNALTRAVETFGVERAGTVYRAMCPMVQGRRGYWLQPQQTIANPYFGAAMLRCGEIVQTLAESHEREGGGQ